MRSNHAQIFLVRVSRHPVLSRNYWFHQFLSNVSCVIHTFTSLAPGFLTTSPWSSFIIFHVSWLQIGWREAVNQTGYTAKVVKLSSNFQVIWVNIAWPSKAHTVWGLIPTLLEVLLPDCVRSHSKTTRSHSQTAWGLFPILWALIPRPCDAIRF